MAKQFLRITHPKTWRHIWQTQIVDNGHDTDPQPEARAICASVKSFTFDDLVNMVNNDLDPDCPHDQRELNALIAVFRSEGGTVSRRRG
tara:strand:- start:336 stop:602 length:267 start_codon:yes stop_codon:yes gene_type:complete